MNETVLTRIVAFILGHKYYANIVNTRGTFKNEICSYIFPTREAADRHRESLEMTASFQFVETISFRSRKEYCKQIKRA